MTNERLLNEIIHIFLQIQTQMQKGNTTGVLWLKQRYDGHIQLAQSRGLLVASDTGPVLYTNITIK